jgi:endonuclease G, mitochondrial
MIINTEVVEASERRLKQANFILNKVAEQFTALDNKLGDGPIKMTPEQRARRYRRLLAETGAPETAQLALERIIGGNDLVGINYLAKGLAAARSVGRIQLRRSTGDVIGFGSGFLIGPGVLMTNHHVFGQAGDARNALVDFDYELDVNNQERTPAHFGFDPGKLFHADEALDFAVVAVNPQSEDGRDLKEWGWLGLSAEPGKADEGEYLTIIQHPAGERKQVCVRENKFVKYIGDMMWYLADTLGGSSGSPVFNRFWQVVALHHSGVPRKKHGTWLTKDGKVWDRSMDETLVDWIANEGVRISSILAHLTDRLGSHPMISALLSTPAPAPEAVLGIKSRSMAGYASAGGQPVWLEQSGGSTSLVVPLHIPMDVVKKEMALPQTSAKPTIRIPALPPMMPVEAVQINQKTLGSRPGYDHNFLANGKLAVPLPEIPASLKAKIALLKKKPTNGNSNSELKYFNYSVVMNKERKLAFFSAVNIDGALRQDVGKREGDTWLRDPRISDDVQIGNEFYGKQKTFEADRSQNPFDRGHLVRRLDATWGADEDKAKEHGDDTFHFTNAAPQFWAFNQGKKLWLGLEEFVLDQLEENRRKACVFNGPVFDGPEAPDGGLPDAADHGRTDPSFGGVRIPKFFWKLMVVVRSGKLAASAFLLSQQDQIMGIDRIHESAVFEKLSEAEAKVFQISIGDLEKFTKLDFGKLAQADTKEATRPMPRRIESLEDIRL